MHDVEVFRNNALLKIEDADYTVESSSVDFEEKVVNISFYDMKHITKYSFIASKTNNGDYDTSICAVFLSGIDSNFDRWINGEHGRIHYENIGESMECKITYEVGKYREHDFEELLHELEDSIYRVRYRKYFAL